MITSPKDTYRRWAARCIIDGRSYDVVGVPSRNLGFDQARSSASVELKTMPPNSAAGKPASVDLGYSTGGAWKWTRFFTGYAAPDRSSVAPISKTVNLVDVLYKLDISPEGDCASTNLNWNNTPWVDAVRATLQAAGITDSEIGSIFCGPVSRKTLADIRRMDALNHTIAQPFADIRGVW